jgi:hypothetical protein
MLPTMYHMIKLGLLSFVPHPRLHAGKHRSYLRAEVVIEQLEFVQPAVQLVEVHGVVQELQRAHLFQNC